MAPYRHHCRGCRAAMHAACAIGKPYVRAAWARMPRPNLSRRHGAMARAYALFTLRRRRDPRRDRRPSCRGQCRERRLSGQLRRGKRHRRMVMAGGTRIAEIAVAGGNGDLLCTPCGACRQRIREFGRADTPVLVCGPDGLRRRFTLGELLPESFGPENLAKGA